MVFTASVPWPVYDEHRKTVFVRAGLTLQEKAAYRTLRAERAAR